MELLLSLTSSLGLEMPSNVDSLAKKLEAEKQAEKVQYGKAEAAAAEKLRRIISNNKTYARTDKRVAKKKAEKEEEDAKKKAEKEEADKYANSEAGMLEAEEALKVKKEALKVKKEAALKVKKEAFLKAKKKEAAKAKEEAEKKAEKDPRAAEDL